MDLPRGRAEHAPRRALHESLCRQARLRVHRSRLGVLRGPWTVAFPFTLDPGPLYEAACHEGNYSMSLMLERCSCTGAWWTGQVDRVRRRQEQPPRPAHRHGGLRTEARHESPFYRRSSCGRLRGRCAGRDVRPGGGTAHPVGPSRPARHLHQQDHHAAAASGGSSPAGSC